MVLYLMVPSPHLLFNLLGLDPDLPQHQLSFIHFFFKNHSMMSSKHEVNVFVCVYVHSQDSRRVQKVLWRQLFVLDSVVSLVEDLESAQQLKTQAAPPQLGTDMDTHTHTH